MAVSDAVLSKWQELQSQYNYPVDSFGGRIEESEKNKFKMWEDLGLYAFMKKGG